MPLLSDGALFAWAFFAETADFCLPGFFGAGAEMEKCELCPAGTEPARAACEPCAPGFARGRPLERKDSCAAVIEYDFDDRNRLISMRLLDRNPEPTRHCRDARPDARPRSTSCTAG